MPVIANTTVISNFAAVAHLDLLHLRFGKVFLSDHVLEEIQNGLTQGYAFYEHFQDLLVPFSPTGWLYLTGLQSPEEFRLYGELLISLHSGEASSLAIAFHRQWTFLSDDKAARERSKAMNVSISGTLGVLSSLVQRNQLPILEADRVLGRMVACGYYSPIVSIQEILPPSS
jgi:predicted nucleic acid-binding protein